MAIDFIALRRKLRGFWLLFRFELPFSAGVCVVLGELLALEGFPSLAQAVLGFASVFLISASALILNDYFDVETDRINAPHRALPAGLVSPPEVLGLFIGVTAAGLAASLFISPAALAAALLVWGVGVLYNWRFKKTGLFGNLLVAFSVGSTFIYGGLVVGSPFEPMVWFFAVASALIDLGEEITGDAMDADGDRLAGSQSLALRFSQATALKISAAVFGLVVLLSFLPLGMGWLRGLDFLPLLLMDGVIIFSTLRLLDARLPDRRKYMRWIYLSGLAAMLLLIIFRLFESIA